MNKITLMSFGFKYGAPRANYYFDVGFLKNPSREENWGFFSTPDLKMREFVINQSQAVQFIKLIIPLLIYLAGIDQNQIIAFGCSAGRHRSSVLVDELAERLTKEGINVNVVHRDLAGSQ